MMKKFNIKKIEKELESINIKNNIDTKVAIQLIVNNLHLYNQVYEEYKTGDTKKVYLLYQLNGQIFKQLKEFRIMPSAFKTEADDDSFTQFMTGFKNKSNTKN